MSEKTKVFVSSRMKTKKEKRERGLAKRIIEEVGCEPILYEREPPKPQAREFWRKRIRDSKFFVFILGEYLSWAIYDEFRTAYTMGNGKNPYFLTFLKNPSFLEKLNPDTLKTLPRDERDKLCDRKITEEQPNAIEWFYNIFNDPCGVKWGHFKDFKEMLKKGIRQQLKDPSSRIGPDEIYSSKEIARIKRVFVPPEKFKVKEGVGTRASFAFKNFEEVKQKFTKDRLLVITGPGGIGKTALGIRLLKDIMDRESFAERDILNPDSMVKRLIQLRKDRKNSLIIFDAPFGPKDKYEPKDSAFAGKFDEVFNLCKENWVVITSRTEPFKIGKTEIERRDIDKYIIVFDNDAWSDGKLKRILETHLDYYLEERNITKEVYDFVRPKSWIAPKLGFPHNLRTFVEDQLENVRDQNTLTDAIDMSKDTVTASKDYFLRLPDNTSSDRQRRYFLLFIALFPDVFSVEDSKPYLEKFFSLYSLAGSQNISLLRGKIKYVRQWGEKLGFEHQHYLDGAIEAVRESESFAEDIAVLSEFFENISKDSDVNIRQAACFALRELARVKHKEALPIALRLLHSKDRQVVESAFVPLRFLKDTHFDEISPHLEHLIDMTGINRSNKTDYKNIIFRKVISDHLIGYYICIGSA